MTARAHSALNLVAPTMRLLPWWHLIGAASIAMSFVLGTQVGFTPSVATATWLLRGAMVVLALSAAFVLDDPTADLAKATPQALMVRRGLRVGIFGLALAGAWGGVLAAVHASGRASALPPLLIGRVTLEFAGVSALTLAAAAASARSGKLPGGVAVAPTALTAVALAVLVPRPWQFFPPYAPPPTNGAIAGAEWGAWAAAEARWLAVALAALAVLLAALVDRSRPPPRPRRERCGVELPAGSETPDKGRGRA